MGQQRNHVGSGLVPVSRRVVLLGMFGAAAGCGGSGGGSGGGGGGTGTATTGATTTTGAGAGASAVVEPPVMVRGREANYHGEKSVAGKSSVTVDLYDFYFEPTVLVGSPGQQLTVDLLNEGERPHTFTVESQRIDVVLQPGQRGQARVVFPRSGQQEVVCRYHIAQGMLGLLAVRG